MKMSKGSSIGWVPFRGRLMYTTNASVFVLRLVPSLVTHMSVSGIEVNGIDYLYWLNKLQSWKPVRKGLAGPCWLCDEIGGYTTYQSPDWSQSQDWAYDICGRCERKIGFGR